MKILVFDIWGEYAHYKKIYATTSPVSYVIPTKTSLYGYVGAIIGLEKNKNHYLTHFEGKSCLVGIAIRKPIIMQRINTNLRPGLSRLKENDNRKPTTIEYVYNPKYRIYFTHKDIDIYTQLKRHLENHTSVYTPTLGLANLLSCFRIIDEYDIEEKKSNASVSVSSVIPRKKFIGFDENGLYKNENEIIEQSLYSVEMDQERNVTERDDVLLDRKGKNIQAFVTDFHTISPEENVVLF
jgi:CRISPR-associated protein Cas5h